MKRTTYILIAAFVILTTILSSCAPAAPVAPQVITQVVEKEVKVEVTKEVIKEVEKQVEVVVTPTVAPTEAAKEIEGFPAADENEAKTAKAAWDAADKGKPDPAWKGKKFTIGVYSAGQRGAISGPTYFFRKNFEQLTGASYDIVEIPFSEMREKIATDFDTGANQYDMIINCSNFYGDYINNDWIQPLDPFFEDARFPKWERDSISPQVAGLYTWGGKWYGSNYDHDAMIFYWRKDIMDDPKWKEAYKKETGEDMPATMATWEDAIKVSKFFNGKDWNGDGAADQGVTLHLKVGGQGFFHYMAFSAPYVVLPNPGDNPSKVTKYNNVYWFDPDTMEPLISSPGHVRALEKMIELSKTGSSAMWGWSLGEAWAQFLSGKAFMTFSWGDVASLAEDKTQSTIMGKWWASGLPGTNEPYSFEKKAFLKLDKPNMVAQQVGCSWHPVLSKKAKNPELAYYWMALMATPPINHWMVTYGWTGVNPGTTYDWFPPQGKAKIEDYTVSGWNENDAKANVQAYADNFFTYPIWQSYLRIPGTTEMQNMSLDTHVSEAITGQLSAQDALNRTAEDWKRVVDEYGKDKLLKLYQDSIGYTPGQ